MKPLTGDHPELKKSAADRTRRTHVCTFRDKGKTCFALLRCMRNTFKGFNTTEPLRHFQIFHEESPIGKSQIEKGERKKRKLAEDLACAAGDEMGSKRKKKRTETSAVGNYFESGPKPGTMSIALAKAARWYMYGRQHVSKSTFYDEFFRDMLCGVFEAGGGSGKVK